jgi:glycosyltransferase involved in cell wall biosynthesis
MNNIKVLMFGWEFPPYYSGGLGTACYGLTKGLSNNNIDVTFVMPQGPEDIHSNHVKLIVASNLKKYTIKVRKFKTLLRPYLSEESYSQEYQRYIESRKGVTKPLYGKDIYEEVYRLALSARAIALSEDYDIIHCHDWMTFPAGMEAKKVTGKPLIVHIHATEFDRTGGNGVNQYVYDMERQGMEAADRIITVSEFVKLNVIKNYGIPESKVVIIHNGIDYYVPQKFDIRKNEKVVLFLGRLTLQKGPDYFIEAAKKVLDYDYDVKFIIFGTGDMEPRLIQRVAELGIGNNVLFGGFVTGSEVDKAFQLADLYVMPSVSEPFGLTPLEALRNNVPVIISKQSGVSEVLRNALKVDFWDVDELANKIISVINYRALHHELQHHGALEVQTFNWNIPAQKCINVYNQLMQAQHVKPLSV